MESKLSFAMFKILKCYKQYGNWTMTENIISKLLDNITLIELILQRSTNKMRWCDKHELCQEI